MQFTNMFIMHKQKTEFFGSKTDFADVLFCFKCRETYNNQQGYLNKVFFIWQWDKLANNSLPVHGQI